MSRRIIENLAKIQLAAMYSASLLDHFENPRNPGEVVAPDASAQIENPACGDILQLTMKIEAGRILQIRFRAKGCVAAMACGSLLTVLVEGKSVEEARRLKREDIVEAIGGLPDGSAHASALAIETLNVALKNSPLSSVRHRG